MPFLCPRYAGDLGSLAWTPGSTNACSACGPSLVHGPLKFGHSFCHPHPRDGFCSDPWRVGTQPSRYFLQEPAITPDMWAFIPLTVRALSPPKPSDDVDGDGDDQSAEASDINDQRQPPVPSCAASGQDEAGPCATESAQDGNLRRRLKFRRRGTCRRLPQQDRPARREKFLSRTLLRANSLIIKGGTDRNSRWVRHRLPRRWWYQRGRHASPATIPAVANWGRRADDYRGAVTSLPEDARGRVAPTPRGAAPHADSGGRGKVGSLPGGRPLAGPGRCRRRPGERARAQRAFRPTNATAGERHTPSAAVPHAPPWRRWAAVAKPGAGRDDGRPAPLG